MPFGPGALTGSAEYCTTPAPPVPPAALSVRLGVPLPAPPAATFPGVVANAVLLLDGLPEAVAVSSTAPAASGAR